MATNARVLEEQTRGYERYITERWSELEDWERQQFVSFAALVSDRGVRKRLVSTPDTSGRARGTSWEESLLGPRARSRTVSLAYAVMLVGIVFLPILLQSIACALGLINIGRRRWEHGIIQVAGSCAILVCYRLGVLGIDDWARSLQDYLTRIN